MHINKKIFTLLLFVVITVSLHGLNYTVDVSSEFKETIKGKQIVYSKNNLSDGNLNKGWIEGSKGDGKGEWIKYTFNKKMYISRMFIYNGLQIDEKRYYSNNRVNEIEVIIDGSDKRRYFLYDTNLANVCNIETEVKELKIIIKDVYHGAYYDDLCIAEIEFETEHMPIKLVDTGDDEIRKYQEIMKEILLGKNVDKNIDYIFSLNVKNNSDKNLSYRLSNLRSMFYDSINSKYFWEKILLKYPFNLGTFLIVTKKTLLFEIAKDIKFNEALQKKIDPHMDIGEIYRSPLYTEYDEKAFKRINNEDLYNPEKRHLMYDRGSFYFQKGDESYLREAITQKIINSKTGDFIWDSEFNEHHWDGIDFEKIGSIEGNLNIVINDLLEYDIDLSKVDSLKLGMSIRHIDFKLTNFKGKGFKLKAVYGYNFVER